MPVASPPTAQSPAQRARRPWPRGRGGQPTGAVVGAAFAPFALVGWGHGGVAAAVAPALFASCSISAYVAMVLPWLFQRLGTDPAVGSGPLAAVIQDLLSIAVYLAIATPLAT